MSVSATEGVTPGLLGQPSTPASSSSNQLDQQTFLQLLVAQLRYQDPMNPTDTSEFMSQSAQFSALEAMQKVAAQTAQMVSTQVAFGASSLVGRTVTFPRADGSTGTGTVSGVRFEASGPVLQVDGTDVAMATVLSVTDGTGSAGSGTGSSTSDTAP